MWLDSKIEKEIRPKISEQKLANKDQINLTLIMC